MPGHKMVYLAVIGVGGVGKAFLDQLHSVQQMTTPRQKSLTQLRLVYVARSSKAVLSADYKPIELESCLDTLQQSDSRPLGIKELVDFLLAAPGPAVLVDNTSDHNIAAAYPQVLSSRISVVTPSKLAFAGDLSLWKDICSSASNISGPPDAGLIFHESTCGAGLPTISTVKDLVRIGNAPTRIEGVLSGTLSYLFNSYMPVGKSGEQLSFSGLVQKAKSMGYTEPDPRVDLGGVDVARKCVILARLCEVDVPSVESVQVQSLIPEALQSCESGDEFLKRLATEPEHDLVMNSLRQDAVAAGKVLRYVASVDVQTGQCAVRLQQFDQSHPMASIKGDDLQLNIYTKHYRTPIVIQGSGEGAYLGVLTDLLRICEAVG